MAIPTPEERAKEFQTPPQPDPLAVPPGVKPSEIIDSPSGKDRSSRGTPVHEHNKARHPVSDKPSMQVDSRTAPSGPRLFDERSQFRKPREIPTLERGQASVEVEQNLRPGTEYKHGNIRVKAGGIIHGGRDVLAGGDDRGKDQDAVSIDRVRALESIIETLLKKVEFPAEFLKALPPELLTASWNLARLPRPSAGSVLVVSEAGAGCETEWGSAGATAYGTAALYKGIFLRGWSKAGASSDWVAMTVAQEVAHPPLKLDTLFVDGTDSYPWYALRPTWDWPRGHS